MMCGKKQLHPIDGQLMTVDEIAGILGVTAKALQVRRSRMGLVSYQLIVDMYREGRICSVHDKWPRYLVDGEWLTIRDIAEEGGVNPHSVHGWMFLHKDATMSEVRAHFREWAASGGRYRGGSRPREHRVYGRTTTVAREAKRLGVPKDRLYQRMSRHGCSLQAAVRSEDRWQRRKAHIRIMRILGYNRA